MKLSRIANRCASVRAEDVKNDVHSQAGGGVGGREERGRNKAAAGRQRPPVSVVDLDRVTDGGAGHLAQHAAWRV